TALHAARPVIVCIQPPVDNILLAEHPMFAFSAVNDRCPNLIVTIRLAGIIPVVIFTALYTRLQVVKVVDRIPTLCSVQVTTFVTPISYRNIPVNTDEVDVCIRPQGIEVEVHVIRSVAGTMRMIL